MLLVRNHFCPLGQAQVIAYSFNKYLFEICSVSDIEIEFRKTAVNKSDKNPCPRGAYNLIGKRVNSVVCAMIEEVQVIV